MQNRPLPKIDHELPMIETGLQRGVRVKTVSFGPNEVETDVEIIIPKRQERQLDFTCGTTKRPTR